MKKKLNEDQMQEILIEVRDFLEGSFEDFMRDKGCVDVSRTVGASKKFEIQVKITREEFDFINSPGAVKL